MPHISILILEGNDFETQNKYRRRTGLTPGQSYANVIRKILQILDSKISATFTLFSPAELEISDFPDGPCHFDAVFITGSSLHVYDYDIHIKRQIDFLHYLYNFNIPIFGSCWGLQITAASLGGRIIKNPYGREIVCAHNINQTKQGKIHLLLEGRAQSFNAPCVHLDMIAATFKGLTVLAENAMAPVQAAEMHVGNTIIWGTQYHPEYSLTDLAGICKRNKQSLIAEDFFQHEEEAESYCNSLIALDSNPNVLSEKFKLGLSDDMIDFDTRSIEIKNFLRFLVLPKLNQQTAQPIPQRAHAT